jgi:hypothetical protein
VYVLPNFKSKKALREAVAAGEEVTVFSPGPFGCAKDGKVFVEGPHYPEPHRWYGSVILEKGRVVKVVG